MNIFSKFLLVIFASFLFVVATVQLQLIGLELMNKPDTGSFYLGLLYCAIVFFMVGSAIYIAVDYLRGLTKTKEDSEVEGPEQEDNK